MPYLNLTDMDDIILNAPVSIIAKEEIKVKDLLENYCYQLDADIIYLAFFIMLMYLMDYIVIPNLKSLFPNKINLLDRINDGFNGLGFMSVIYLLWLGWLQIGFNAKSYFIISIFIFIILIGLLINFIKWKKRRG